MILHLAGEINGEKVDKLIDAINIFNKQPNDKLNIYFRSDGGDVESQTAIIHLINSNSANIHLIAYGIIYSAAFFIFFNCKCERTVLHGTVGMCHYARVGIEVGDNNKGYYSSDKANQSWAKEENMWVLQFCIQLGMSVKEINLIKKTQEVYFQVERLQELLENSKNAE